MQDLIDNFINSVLRARFLTLAASFVLLLAGIVAWKVLPIEAYPELSNPQVRVITLYPGKGAEEVEKLVTIPVEKQLNGIPGQLALRSLSLYGLSVITTTFSESIPTTLARQQVLERLQEADIPENVSPGLEPDVGSLREIFRYSLHSPYYSTMGLRSIQQWDMEKLFRQIPGVIGVVSEGGLTKAYEVNLDPYRLKAYGVSLEQAFSALQQANATSGGGFIAKNGNALIVRELGLLQSLEDIRNVPVKNSKTGVPIRIGDIADVSVGSLVRRGQVGKNEEPDVVEGIILLRRGENPSRVLENLYERLPAIIKRLPAGISFEVLYDRAKLVNQTMKTVGTNVAIGIGLVILLLWLFLIDLQAALITACVIPLAILFAFICLNLFNVPANLLSLGAIDFGILVDSAVVMTENIMRRLSNDGQDMNKRERLFLLNEAAREVGTPIIFGIAVIVATFLPIFTFSGVEGKLFRPLAATMVSALIGAALIALALIPVLCSFFLTNKPLKEKESPIISLTRALYRPALKAAISFKWVVVLLAGIAFVFSMMSFSSLGSEFLPHLEEGNIWLRATLKPVSVTLDESVRVANEIRSKLLKFPEITEVLSQAGGPDDGTDPARFADHEYYIDLKPAKDWRPEFHEDKENLIASIRKELTKIPGVSYYFTQYIQTTLDEALSGVQGSLVAKVSGPDLKILESTGQQVGQIMSSTPGIVDVIVDPLLGQPQLSIEIDRVQAARYGLNVQALKNAVEICIGGQEATTVIEGERRYKLMVRLQPQYRSSEEALKDIMIDTPQGQKIPISQVARISETNGATQIWRDAGSRIATIRANVRGRDLATAVKDAQEKVAATIKLPSGYQVEWSGEFQRQREASRQLEVILPVTLAVILVILYLACGTVRGAIVMFSVVPLASIGAVLSLHVTHTYFSIAAGVGLIALFGLSVKNGILLVSFVNELRQQGENMYEAVIKGCLIRLRPVVMTAIIAAAGLLPAALSNEIGSQTQKPFAIVIIGGLVSCTLLTLFVLPALYMCMSPKPGKDQTEPKKGNAEAAAL